MLWFKKLLLKIGFLRKGARFDEDLSEEMQLHLELMVEGNIQAGMAAAEARKAAIKKFGNLESIREDCHENWGVRIVTDLIQDLRYSIRSLWKSKGFSFAVIATLTLCIGANTTIFSSLYHLVLKPLPFKDADRFVHIYNYDNRIKRTFPVEPLFDRTKEVSAFTITATGLASVGQYLDYQEKATLFEGFAIMNSHLLNVSKDGGIDQARGLNVSHGIFELLGVKPLIGRFFSEDESTPGNDRVMVLPERVWRSDYDSNPYVLGKTVTVDLETSYTIIGVAPESMDAFEYGTEFFTPFVMRTGGTYERMAGRIWIAALWGKLKEGVSREAAQAQLQLIEEETLRNELALHGDRSGPLTVGHLISNDHRPEIGRWTPLKAPLFLLQAGAVFVMMIGCMNVINLLLSRAISKIGELSVRNALGAGRFGLARLLFLESFILALVALVLGCLIAWGGLESINTYMAVSHPKVSPVTMDFQVLAILMSLSFVLALVMGLAPFSVLWKTGKIQKIESTTRSMSTGRNVSILNKGLVATQVSVAFVLIVGAGLLLRSFSKVLSVDPGIDAKQVIQVQIHLMNFDKYRKVEGALRSIREEIMTSVRGISGVESVSLAVENPLDFNRSNAFLIKGVDYTTNDDPLPLAKPYLVDNEFFATMGIRILAGEPFIEDTLSETGIPEVAVIGKGVYDRYFLDKEAVGSVISNTRGTGSRTLHPDQPGQRIIGVADRANFAGLEDRDGLPIIYYQGDMFFRDAHLLVRTQRHIDNVQTEIRKNLSNINQNIVVKDIKSVKTLLDEKHLDRQSATYLIGCFAGLALLLSGIGLYGVLAYSVMQRRKEIGVRTAVGATSRKVQEMVIRQGMTCIGAGIGFGIIGAVLLSKFLESQLFDISPFDPVTYAAGIFFFLIVGLAASYFPARRAIRVDPIEALRVE